jgi:hypothetical protein
MSFGSEEPDFAAMWSPVFATISQSSGMPVLQKKEHPKQLPVLDALVSVVTLSDSGH